MKSVLRTARPATAWHVSAVVLLALMMLAWFDARGAESPRHTGSSGAEHGQDGRAPQLLASSLEISAGDWPRNGRTPGEDRFSPLEQINEGNVADLGLAWSYDTGTDRGLEATPVVIDGVMYTSASWSIVMALDAATGEERWRFDPQVDEKYDDIACCDVVNRGVAVHDNKVFVGALDGRLIALDTYTGEPVWEAMTIDQDKMYSITGAPRVVKGQVIIGNGGAEFGVRGYVSAYDAATGELNWRFYTIPGDYQAPGTPKLPPDERAMALAAETWGPDTLWEAGGGGTAWDSFAYDPELDLLYIGVGNGSPWNQLHRDPSGGDNLFLASIVALDPDDGSYVWHYQTTPGETWDYTATQQMILADLWIPPEGGAGPGGGGSDQGSSDEGSGGQRSAGGELRKVIMQAPKNGFFYVIDRETGEFISADNYVTVTWAEGIDPDTGRPIEAPGARYETEPAFIRPAPLGGHNWQPMSFNPQTGLVYIPAQDNAIAWEHLPRWEFRENSWLSAARTRRSLEGHTFPDDGHLIAWDPVAQEPVWAIDYDNYWNGGTLSTAGNLVFQGTASGDFVAYRATDGELLWQSWSRTGILGGPVSYEVDGTQYVAVMAGWGGAFATRSRNEGKIFAFALGGDEAAVAAGRLEAREPPAPVEQPGDATAIAAGGALFETWCAQCHGGGTTLPDLRYSDPEVYDRYRQIVLGGERADRGMPPFGAELDLQQVQAIAAWVIEQRNALGR